MSKEGKRYVESNYKVSWVPVYEGKKHASDPKMQKLLKDLYFEIKKDKPGMVDKLNELIIKYPAEPILKNYLSVAYSQMKNEEKANEVNDWLIKEHPDYLFGKLNLAYRYYYEEKYEKMAELLGSLMEIQQLYPERKEFHITEVMSFYKAAVMYFVGTKNIEAARDRLAIMKKLEPKAKETEFAEKQIIAYEIQEGIKIYKERSKTVRNVKTTRPFTEQTKEKPVFIHKKMELLYVNGMRIDQSILKKILDLPRETLINDLEQILEDSKRRYEYFENLVKEDKWTEQNFVFPLHALFLLAELKAENSMPALLDILRQGEEFVEFWLNDSLTEDLWEIIYKIGIGQLEVLKEFIKEPNIYTYIRSEISEAVKMSVIYEPERREEVIEWYRDLFAYFIKNKEDENLIDTSTIGFMIGDVVDIHGTELLKEIEELHEKNLVDLNINGELKTVIEEIKNPFSRTFIRNKVLSIYDKYDYTLKNWNYYKNEYDIYPEREGKEAKNFNKHEDEDEDEDDYPIEPLKAEQKIGRMTPALAEAGKSIRNAVWNKF